MSPHQTTIIKAGMVVIWLKNSGCTIYGSPGLEQFARITMAMACPQQEH